MKQPFVTDIKYRVFHLKLSLLKMIVSLKLYIFDTLFLKPKFVFNGDIQFEPLIENCYTYCPFHSKFMISTSPQTHFGFINMATFLFKNNDISFQLFMWDTLYLIFVEIHLKLALFESAIDIFDKRLKNLTFHHLFLSSRFSICGLKR